MGLSSIRSFFNGQSSEKFGEGKRFPLTKEMVSALYSHLPALRKVDMKGYVFERRRSIYPGAKSDIVVYNAQEQPVVDGREIGGNSPFSFWDHAKVV